MEYIEEKPKMTPIISKGEVVIIGGGAAGFIAAISAAYNGTKVILIEKSPFIGGTIIHGPLEAIMTFHDSKKQIIQGITQEFIDRLRQAGGSIGHVKDDVGYCETITPVDTEIMKLVALEMLQECGVNLFLDSLATDVVMKKDAIKAVIIENKSGRQAIIGDIFIDCSGDGDLCALAGNEFEKGRGKDRLLQPMTLLFKVNGVDIDRLVEYVKTNKEQFKLESKLEDLKSNRILHLWGFSKVLEKGFENGALSLKRKELHMATTLRKNEVIINFTRIAGDGTKIEDINTAQIIGTKQAHELVELFKKRVPGFEQSYISYTGNVGVRETRRIKGDYTVVEDDILNSRRFEDVVARGAFPIDIHQADSDSMEYKKVNQAYDIPYRALLPNKLDNVFMAGRCISVSHKALASIRISATCMAIGEAVGVASALCVKENLRPRDLDIQKLQLRLIKQGILLEKELSL